MTLAPTRLSVRDTMRVGATGLRTRPMRAFLSALGIAIGVATMVAVVGISQSNRADLLNQLDSFGTNMLTVTPGSNLFGQGATLPDSAVQMVRAIKPVQSVAATGDADATIRRADKIATEEAGGVAGAAAPGRLRQTLRTSIAAGTWLNHATARYPAVVLGDGAANRLGVTQPGSLVWVKDRWFSVAG